MAAAAAQPTYKKEGSGAYGLVVSPALPNDDEEGAEQRFPGMVSKLMIDEGTYRESLETMEKLKKNTPALSFDFVPYRREYRFRNLPTSQMKRWLRDQIEVGGGEDPRNDTRVYVVRMPNLGKSFKAISDTPRLSQAYRRLGPEVLLKQILKLCRVVKNVKDSGYVHADIRETNVLANTRTGDLTIIDFDWLRTKDRYYREYPSFYYSHPPEEVFFMNMDITHLIGFLKDPDRERQQKYQTNGLNAILNVRNAHLYFWRPNVTDMINTVRDSVFMPMYNKVQATPLQDQEAVAREEIKKIRDASYSTVDSYGLALSVIKLVSSLGLDGPLPEFLIGNWAKRMLSYNVFDRQTIEESIDILEKYIRENYPSIQLGEAPDFNDELARLSAIAELLQDKPVPNNSPRNVREEVEALALVTRYLEGGDEEEVNAVPSPPQPNAAAGGGAARSPLLGGKQKKTRRHKKRKGTQRKRTKGTL